MMYRSWSKFESVKCEFWLSEFIECECKQRHLFYQSEWL